MGKIVNEDDNMDFFMKMTTKKGNKNASGKDDKHWEFSKIFWGKLSMHKIEASNFFVMDEFSKKKKGKHIADLLNATDGVIVFICLGRTSAIYCWNNWRGSIITYIILILKKLLTRNIIPKGINVDYGTR